MGNKRVKIWVSLLTMVTCLTAFSCVKKTGPTTVDRLNLFWPGPPEMKRIEFVNTISGPRDLNIQSGFFTSVFRFIGGIQEGAIVSPHGITRDTEGRLYTVDTFLGRIHMFDEKANQYTVFPSGGKVLQSPVDIAVDDLTGRIFVTDSKQAVVDVFTNKGENREASFGGGIFKRPTGIAINRKAGELLVVDTLLSQVFRFELSTLTFKGLFGRNGKGDGEFHYPTHVFVTPEGDVIISDSLNFRAQVFSDQGRFLFSIGRMGTTPGTFSRPKGVAADSDGNIYVVDALFDNIQVFDRKGRLLLAFGDHGRGLGTFFLPTGIYIDHNDRIYVSDSRNRRIQVFQYLKEDMEK